MSIFSESGFEKVDNYLSAQEVMEIKEQIRSVSWDKLKGGIRNAEKKYVAIRTLVASEKFIDTARQYLNGEPVLVRVLLFNKTAENNWLVAWHQDKTVALNKKQDLEGWSSWSIKDGAHHVQPPLDVLDNMVTFRIHLDAALKENGCLRIIPKSHKLGIIKTEDIPQYANKTAYVDCIGNAGMALVMKPLLLHASSKATAPSSRLVLHVEYSSYKLPDGLSWA